MQVSLVMKLSTQLLISSGLVRYLCGLVGLTCMHALAAVETLLLGPLWSETCLSEALTVRFEGLVFWACVRATNKHIRPFS